MSTPAERLLAAADLLDKRASEATEGPWIATISPEVGKAMAAALREDANKITRSTLVQPFYKGNAELLAIAELVLPDQESM